MQRPGLRQQLMAGSLDKNKILIGMSGGVDSTTAALLLEEKGFEVSGLYFDITGKNTEGQKAAKAAFEAAGCRGEFFAVDASAEFEEKVETNFIDEYIHGRTPNPCIICNPLIKFRLLMEYADKIGAYYIGTGHYSNVSEKDGLYYIKAADSPKDQSYMLYRLSQDVISRIIFPLAMYDDKEKVRDVARDAKLPNAELKDSQEICFVPGGENYIDFIKKSAEKPIFSSLKGDIKRASAPGDFADKDGKVLGKHKGILSYTIGQRKGLGIALGKPAFVTDIDSEKGHVVLGENEDLMRTEISARGAVFSGRIPLAGEKLKAKIRYAAKPAECTVLAVSDDAFTLAFDMPQRAPTPGQSLVLYDPEGRVLGGGFIHN